MKQILYSLILAAFCTGCSEAETEAGNESGYGAARFTAAASAEVNAITRAAVELPAAAIPAAGDFALRITGTYEDEGEMKTFDQNWAAADELDTLMVRRGEYKAAILSGDIEAEGADAACFGGEADFTIFARQTIGVNVTATLLNAAFRMEFGEWFLRYYSDAQITIRTESGNSFTFTPSKKGGLIFVMPATALYMKGTAVKSQTGTAVEFPETQIGTTQARTLHTIAVSASQAGASGLEIRLDDTFTPVPEQVIELNPDADPVE